MITILVDERSNRLEYTLSVIFDEWLLVEYEVKTSVDRTESFLINYSSKDVQSDLKIYNEGLLGENNIRFSQPEIADQDGLPLIFLTQETAYDLPFDIFSAVFFSLSRYEEYITKGKDKHGRFQAGESIFSGYHRTPYLDRWVGLLDHILVKNGAKNPREIKFTWINTMDMDIAFAFKGRSTFRKLGASVKDLIHMRLQRLQERNRVVSGKTPDPFDTYDLFLNAKGSNQNILFVPTGKRGEYDNNLSIETRSLRAHIGRLSTKVEVGLHPSYQSLGSSSVISKEKAKLETALNAPIRKSRQHFLRFQLPETYRSLIENGIEEDYSMGFHDDIGFRSGTAHIHSFFDLINDYKLHIKLIPLIAMDSAMRVYLEYSPEQAISTMKEVIFNMSLTGGNFVSVWHNHSLSDLYEWNGWRKVYLALPDLVSTSS
ncbi:MAG: polysaccharide deacetylase family protein [Flavobacteriales bacterium]|nr:polysaccharide deacetylase family protein [Flavobacteriales bacterium]